MVLRVTRYSLPRPKSGLSLLAPGKPGQAPKLGVVTDFFQCAQESKNRRIEDLSLLKKIRKIIQLHRAH